LPYIIDIKIEMACRRLVVIGRVRTGLAVRWEAVTRESSPAVFDGATIRSARVPTRDTRESSMSITNTPHLNFRGDARQALEFYRSVFGGQLMIATYGQFGVPRDDPNGGPVTLGPVAADSPDADRVAFGVLAGDGGFRVAAYDVFGATGGGIAGLSAGSSRRARGLTHDESFFLLLNGDTAEEVSALWDGLADGATVIAALATGSSNAPPYGMLTDRFGVTWIVGVTPAR
jgi:PhnB protein